MRVLIVDDEPVGRERLRALLEEAKPEAQIVGECDNGRCAVEAIAVLAPDLVFLDVQMPQMDGLAVARALGSRRFPLIVFASGFDRYAVEAFDFHFSSLPFRAIQKSGRRCKLLKSPPARSDSLPRSFPKSDSSFPLRVDSFRGVLAAVWSAPARSRPATRMSIRPIPTRASAACRAFRWGMRSGSSVASS